ncbi:MAG: hypothetical protein ACKOOI_08020, partial [Pirellula sp.]
MPYLSIRRALSACQTSAANNEIAPQIHELAHNSVIDKVVNYESSSLANYRLIMDVINQRN